MTNPESFFYTSAASTDLFRLTNSILYGGLDSIEPLRSRLKNHFERPGIAKALMIDLKPIQVVKVSEAAIALTSNTDIDDAVTFVGEDQKLHQYKLEQFEKINFCQRLTQLLETWSVKLVRDFKLLPTNNFPINVTDEEIIDFLKGRRPFPTTNNRIGVFDLPGENSRSQEFIGKTQNRYRLINNSFGVMGIGQIPPNTVSALLSG